MEKYVEMIQKCRFKVFHVQGYSDGRSQERVAIVLVDTETDLVVMYTDYADFIQHKRMRDMHIKTVNQTGVYAVVQFLNFVLVDNFALYQITDIRDINQKMVKDFLDDYASTVIAKSNDFPSRKSVTNKRAAICEWLATLCEYKDMHYIKPKDLMAVEYKIDTGTRRRIKVLTYGIHVTYHREETGRMNLMRDMPLSILPRLIQAAEIYDPELTLAIVLQGYAGLREGEVCNVRGIDSCLGPGLIITSVGGSPYSMEIDLSQEAVLRSDGKNVGRIKKERHQEVYEPYVPIIHRYYEKHMQLIKNKKREDTKPLFLNSRPDANGFFLAMTISGYRRRIQQLFYDHVLPSLEKDPDPNLARYYLSMRTHTWGAHALRHLFTVQLVLSLPEGSQATLQMLRGDRSPKSAIAYLRNKGDLIRQYKSATNILGEMIRTQTKKEEEDLWQ